MDFKISQKFPKNKNFRSGIIVSKIYEKNKFFFFTTTIPDESYRKLKKYD